ncbi:uncharacterized protein LOC110921720 isoform X2 [Helianthus annuus]|uniref:uncharacterized protein LOC110921720 isoform X2 n=1 Tax=Helianthus annuus TaxID=4232 RepID=UPI0016530907|nr:uncharacterized protein LOC110921720 isoform X2 [Helianthus annuus]
MKVFSWHKDPCRPRDAVELCKKACVKELKLRKKTVILSYWMITGPHMRKQAPLLNTLEYHICQEEGSTDTLEIPCSYNGLRRVGDSQVDYALVKNLRCSKKKKNSYNGFLSCNTKTQYAEPLSILKKRSCSWSDYYEWRGIPLDSSVALLLHWPLTIYQAIQLAFAKQPIIETTDKLCIHYLGPERELYQTAVFGELHALLPGVQLHIDFVGPAVPHDRCSSKARSFKGATEVHALNKAQARQQHMILIVSTFFI